MVFATLDPTVRRVEIPELEIISDTVGLISHLPTLLIDSFRATQRKLLERFVTARR